ncbi:hypothetical protein H0O00_00445 [Candidatus Micrarchaeota archaeon]|nr:hypothetical protein [Candidatus Micrarchaeota archaeon]
MLFAAAVALNYGMFCVAAVPLTAFVIGLVFAIPAVRKIEFFEYSVDSEGISYETIYSSEAKSVFWELVRLSQLLRSLRLRAEYHFENIASAKEDVHDGSRVLVIRERGFLTPEGGAGLRIYLPDENADEIIAEIRRRMEKHAPTQ